MEVHNLSIDDNEADTSQDEVEDEDFDSLFKTEQSEHQNNHDEILHKNSSCPFSSTCPSMIREFRKWERPKIDRDAMFYNSTSVRDEQPDPFNFYLLDVVSTVTGVRHPKIKLDKGIEKLPLHNVIRLFGITTIRVPAQEMDNDLLFSELEENYENHDKTKSISVCCNVHGFLPYFYALPLSTTLEDVNEEEYWKTADNNETFKEELNSKIKLKILGDISCVEYHEFVAGNEGQCILKIEVIKTNEVDGIYHFHESKRTRGQSVLLKIYCTLPRFIWTANTILSESCSNNSDKWKFLCFESNINNTIRFLADRNMTGCTWYELEGNRYYLRNTTDAPRAESHCQIELDVHFENIYLLEDSHARCKFNPAVRVLSFDIEVMVTSKEQNMPMNGPNGWCACGNKQVLQISAVLGNYYSGANPKESILGKAVFVLGSCDPIKDVSVFQFYAKEQTSNTSTGYEYEENAEGNMLAAFRDFILLLDPDIIIGYNIKKFDLPYLIERSFKLSDLNQRPAASLSFLGRLEKMRVKIRGVQNDLKKVHQYDDNNVNINGRIMLDFYPLLVRHDQRRGEPGFFKLSNVAKRFLNKDEEKQDVHFTEIEGLQKGNSTTRSRMARYCIQDSMIPYLLLFEPVPCRNEKINLLDLYFKKSHAGGTPLRYLFNKSNAYNEYVKAVRVQKNPGKAIYVPDTPSPKKPYLHTTPRNAPITSSKSVTNTPTKKPNNSVPTTKNPKICKRLFQDSTDFME